MASRKNNLEKRLARLQKKIAAEASEDKRQRQQNAQRQARLRQQRYMLEIEIGRTDH